METGKAAPTGCYKCGRPGHWSRDCPDSNPNLNPKSANLSDSNPSISFPFKPSGSNSKAVVDKRKKVPRTRPKLTSEILVGDDGLGYVLRNFPRNFKYRGRGHEVNDLGNLIHLYREWHSHLLPYYSFDQFVHKVEQVAATKHVKMCLRDLRERVAHGGDPTKLHESPTENVDPNLGQDHSTPAEAVLHDKEGPSLRNHDSDVMQDDMPHEIYDGATKELPHSAHVAMEYTESSLSNEVSITDEQRARMEANRLKALERAAARACSFLSS